MASNPIETIQLEGFPDGVNLAQELHELKDTEARYLQDVLVYKPGIMPRRGPVQARSGAVSFTDRAIGIVTAQNPLGAHRVAVIHGDGSNAYFGILSTDYTTKTDISLGFALSTSLSYLVDIKPALNGAAFVGISSQYDVSDSTHQWLLLWGGAGKATYTTGTCSATRGSTTVTGTSTTWSTNLESGMYMFATGGELIGTIKTVDSNTQVTLVDGALHANSGTYTAKSVRGIRQRIATGRITCTTSSSNVTGANTKFKVQMTTGSWRIWRMSDLAHVGFVNSISSDTALDLSANASVNMDNERYVAVQENLTYPYDTVTEGFGFITAVYARRQFYANRAVYRQTSKVYWSDPTDLEAVDLSARDGDWINAESGSSKKASTPVKAMIAAYNSLLILKENEAFALYGDAPEQFELRHIADDGVLCGMAAQPYKEGVIFPGREGIWYYDGTGCTNISQDKLGDFYKRCVKDFDPTAHRMWGCVDRDHYLLHIENVSSPVDVIRGNTATSVSRLTIVIYLPTMSFSFFTNVDIRGHVALPHESGEGTWYIVNNSSGQAVICSLDDLFDQTGLDTITCEGNTAGPSWYIEMKRFSADEQVRIKLWKQLSAQYKIDGDSMTIDVIPGLDDPGIARSYIFPNTAGEWKPKRKRFLKRAHHIGIRVYETSPGNATEVELGPFAIVLKRQRPQRV